MSGARAILRQRAHDSGAELAAAFTQTRARSGQALAALDANGKVVIADEEASLFLGVPARVPALDPAVRWHPGLDLGRLARHAMKQARLDHDWVGSTQIVDRAQQRALPDHACARCSSPTSRSARSRSSDPRTATRSSTSGPSRGLSPPPRIVGVSGERMVLLRRPEVRFAEADGNDVWLVTDEGRLQAAVRGIDKLEGELAGGEFLRVHRRFLVNLSLRPRGRARAARRAVADHGRHGARGGARVPPQRPRRAARPRALTYEGTRGRFIVR